MERKSDSFADKEVPVGTIDQ